MIVVEVNFVVAAVLVVVGDGVIVNVDERDEDDDEEDERVITNVVEFEIFRLKQHLKKLNYLDF